MSKMICTECGREIPPDKIWNQCHAVEIVKQTAWGGITEDIDYCGPVLPEDQAKPILEQQRKEREKWDKKNDEPLPF